MGSLRSLEPGTRVSKAALFRTLGYEPHPGQQLVHASPARRRVLACGVRWGKSLCAAFEALAAAMEPRDRSMGWVVAPTYDLADKIYREVVLIAQTRLRHRVLEMREADRRLVLLNLAGGRSEIKAKTADNPVSLLGEGLDWLVVDEAARLKPSIFESYLLQRLIDRDGWALIISTPRGRGWFFEAFQRGQHRRDPDFESWNMPSWSNPYVARDVIEQERARLPDRVFRQEFGGEFIEGAGQVFRGIHDAATGEFHPYDPTETYVMGLDLAKVVDFTVAVVMDSKKRVVHFDRFHRLDWSLQIARIKAASERYGRPRIFVDTTGAGEPIYEALCREGLYVQAYPFTASSKAALIDHLSLLLERREITLPRPDLCPDLIDELDAFEFSVSEAGNTKSGAPVGMHDDCVIALGLAAWASKWAGASCGVRFL